MMRNYVRGCCRLWTACMMLSCLGGVLFTRPAGAQHAAAVQVAPPPVGGKLARAVLLGGDPLTAQDLPPDLPSSDRLRLLAYLERRADFRSRLGTSSSGGPVAAHQGRLERDIATVVERAGMTPEVHQREVGAELHRVRFARAMRHGLNVPPSPTGRATTSESSTA